MSYLIINFRKTLKHIFKHQLVNQQQNIPFFNSYKCFSKRKMSSTTVHKLETIVKLLPAELHESKHKGQAGRIGIIGGCVEYTGAPYFAGITALKSGADLVYVFCMKDAAIPIKSYSPELIVLPFLDDDQGKSLIISRLNNLHSLVIGPGLGENAQVHFLITNILQYITDHKNLSKMSLIFDADGIGFLADNKNILSNYSGSIYLTPNLNEIKKLAYVFLNKREINVEDENDLKNLVKNINPNTTIILKGLIDQIISVDNIYHCTVLGSLRRCGGQGDLLSGSLGLFSYWAILNDEKIKSSISSKIIASYAACSLTRLCNKLAYEKHGRNMITSNMIDQIETSFKLLFDS